MNAFAPRYDPDAGRAVMYPHPDGVWVHVADVLEMKDEVERLRDIVEVNDQRLADVWDTSRRVLAEALKERDEARAEVKRLREVVRQVHALVSTVRATAVLDDIEKLREIHSITKKVMANED